MISNKEFLIDSFPTYHPKTLAYKDFWINQEYRKLIEGMWASGKWMPPTLYFYGNYATIELVKAGAKSRTYDRPMVRDLEWNLFLLWAEARGFSGFELDEHYTCNRLSSNPDISDEYLRKHDPHVFKPDGTRKQYVEARKYLRKIHHKNLGSPRYMNEAMNLMMLGPRTFGKSYSAGGIVAHEFTVDGRTKFNLSEKSTTNIIVGAGDAKYSSDLLQKTKLTLDRLPGEVVINNIKYPSPFSKITSGSLHPGKELVHKYKKKIGSNWETVGTLSKIKNRTFKDNPYAAQGNRCGVIVFEEIGMFGNMMDSYNACVDVLQDGHYKFGSALFIGTGGAMESGGTLDAYKMFYNPSKFKLLEFEDIWEHSQAPIAYFVPSYMGLHQYKDSEGNTMVEEAKAKDDEERRKLMDGKSSKALDSYIAYHPRVPSEVFLTTKGAFFPVAELQNRLRTLRSSNETAILSKRVELFFDPKTKTGVNYQIDIDNKLRPLDEFPTDQKVREGCVVIYEMPQIDEDGDIPQDLYIIGHDPYSSDNPEGNSLAGIYVMKTKAHPFKYGHDEIVAQYVGRPHLGRKIVNEILLKLSLFYGNAKVYFENATGNTKEYFEKHKKLSLLCRQPRTILNKKASFDTTPTPIYGYPMSNRQIKLEGIQYLRDWLIEERGKDLEGNIIRNLDLIADQALLQELIQFNLSGNFDRVMSLIGCVIGLEETFNQYENQFTKRKEIVDLSFLNNNKSIFTNVTKHKKLPSSTSAILQEIG